MVRFFSIAFRRSRGRGLGWALVLGIASLVLAPRDLSAAEPPQVSFVVAEGRLSIAIGDKPFGGYVWFDSQVTRPFFVHLHTPEGMQLTRTFPPPAEYELTDHATFHPGMWLAFGDLSGRDFWRNQVPVQPQGLIEDPQGGPGRGTFAVKNRYAEGDEVLAEEVCRIDIRAIPAGTLLIWDSTFTAGPKGCSFGDQEEMGLGLRLSRVFSVQRGGTILNSEGRRDEAGAWGRQADWCAYYGQLNQSLQGVLLVPDPQNFRRSWFHVRDYGLLAANPFGEKSFGASAEPSKVELSPGQELRLRFGVLFFSGAEPTWESVAGEVVKLLDTTRSP